MERYNPYWVLKKERHVKGNLIPHLVNFQTNFQIKENKFIISESPTGQENIFMIPKKGNGRD